MASSELVNHFDRLPTELIISILEKTCDVESLCACSSVSKIFSALVPQTRFVSVQIPSCIRRASPGQVWPQEIVDFLKKLTCVEHVTIRFSPFCPATQPPLVRYMTDSSRFILVAARSRESDSDASATSALTSKEYYCALADMIMAHMYRFTMRDVHVKVLLPILPKLNKVSAFECTEQGSSFVWEEDIDGMKKRVTRSEDDEVFFCVKQWRVPSVKLPMSGCAMNDVILISMREMEGGHGYMDENSFKETEYRELAMITMKEHPLGQIDFPIPSAAMFGKKLCLLVLSRLLLLNHIF